MNTERFLVTGRVQGVGFRYFVYHTARKIGVVGYVKNLPDGRVECGARGTPEQLAQLLTALRKGPSMSQVDQVQRDPGATIADTGRFEMTY